MEFQVVSRPKFAGPFSSNAGGMIEITLSFRFSISCPGGGGLGSAPGELTTLSKTPSWMRERLRAGKSKMGRKGEKVKVRDWKGRRGEERGKGKGPASQGRDRRRGKGRGREGRLKEEGGGEQGRPSYGRCVIDISGGIL